MTSSLGQGRDRPLPLSFDQERMWLFDRQLSASVSYDDPLVARLRGPLRLTAITAALARVAARHESLRTRFPLAAGVPQQQVDTYTPTPVRLIDLSNLAYATRHRMLNRLVAAEPARPFDLQRGPLYRATFVRLAPDDHLVMVSIHHLAGDLWSMALIIEELSAAYRAVLKGGPPRLPRLGAQPADLAVRQRQRLTPRRASALRAYWRDRLAGVKAVDLPADHPRPARPNLSVHVYRSRLDDQLSEALRRFSRDEGVTLFITMLAGFQALLTRWSGQTDLVVRSVSAGRRGSDAERVVGTLTQCLVLRADTAGDPTVRQLLGRSREAALDALDGADLPFAEIVALADPGRDLEPSPLRQLGLSVHNVPRAVPSLGADLTLAAGPNPPAPLRPGISEADLWLEVFDAGHGPLELQLKMDDQMFAPESLFVTRQRLAILLADAVARPAARLSQLELAGPALRSRAPSTGSTQVRRHQVSGAATETVRAVTGVVESLLGVAPIAGHDNFFRLGGGSLDAVRLITRLRQRFGAEISLADILASPTIEQIADAVDTETRRCQRGDR